MTKSTVWRRLKVQMGMFKEAKLFSVSEKSEILISWGWSVSLWRPTCPWNLCKCLPSSGRLWGCRISHGRPMCGKSFWRRNACPSCRPTWGWLLTSALNWQIPGWLWPLPQTRHPKNVKDLENGEIERGLVSYLIGVLLFPWFRHGHECIWWGS